MKTTQTNMEGSERDIERANSKHEKDSDQPRQNKELSLSHGRGLGIKSLTRTRTRNFQIMPPHVNYLFIEVTENHRCNVSAKLYVMQESQ